MGAPPVDSEPNNSKQDAGLAMNSSRFPQVSEARAPAARCYSGSPFHLDEPSDGLGSLSDASWRQAGARGGSTGKGDGAAVTTHDGLARRPTPGSAPASGRCADRPDAGGKSPRRSAGSSATTASNSGARSNSRRVRSRAFIGRVPGVRGRVLVATDRSVGESFGACLDTLFLTMPIS